MGTKNKNAQSGVVTFDNLYINTVGTYNLKAFITNKTDVNVISAGFNITFGAPNSLILIQQPSSESQSMVNLNTLPIVRIYDSGNNVINSFSWPGKYSIK